MIETGPVVLHHGAIGDTIQLTAMLRALAARWEAPCSLVSGCPAAGEVLAGLSSVAEIRNLDHRRVPYLLSANQRGTVEWLSARRASPHYLIEPRRHRVAPWSDATRFESLLDRAGVSRSHRLTMEDLPRQPLEHLVDYLLRLAVSDPEALDGAAPGAMPLPAPVPELSVSAEEVAAARAWLRRLGWQGEPLILFQTTTRRRGKGVWPAASWRVLVRAVLESEPGASGLLVGAPAEHRHTARLAAAVALDRLHDVAAEMSLRRLFSLLTLAHSLLSMDSAPAHAAAALGCPVVVICGRADPRRNRPTSRSGPVETVTAWEGAPPPDPYRWYQEHDIARIEPGQVLEAWRALRR